MKKYMNPGLARPPNTGLISSTQVNPASQRGPLLKLAGLNVPSPSRQSTISPKGKVSLAQHTAKGLHGPAHSTGGRVMASTAVVSSSTSQHGLTKKIDIGSYDGGLEVDDGREVVTGESAKILAMDNAVASSYVLLLHNRFCKELRSWSL
jgi:aurora kinase